MMLLQAIFLLLWLLLSVPALVFVLQLLMARSRQSVPATGRRPSIAVLVPAHDEALGIVATLVSIRTQLQVGDRVLVVADNCSDDTAAVAIAAGAEAIARVDAVLRGKSHALDFGVRHLALAPPEVVIVIDADCLLEPGALDRLARLSLASARPVQALYLMRSPPGASLKGKVAEFAWAVKNWARALGYQRLGLPCQLMGSGMAFPWPLMAQAELASGHIVEDLKLGLDCARQGRAPLFCPEAEVSSVFPANVEGAQSQRTRWEHGHLAMIVKEGPALILESVRSKNRDLLALALDMCVPPLALLVLLSLALCALALLPLAFADSAMPWLLALINPLLLGCAVLLAWSRFGRPILSLGDLAYAPVYALRKIPLYLKFLVRRQVEWVRSHRDKP